MPRTLRTLTLLTLACLMLSESATAQEPKAGRDWYEDEVDIGFKFKSPDGWGFVPAQADDVGLIGKYVAPGSQFIQDPKTGRYWDYTCYILKFDRRGAADEDGKKGRKRGVDTLPEWVDGALGQINLRKVEQSKGRVGKLDTIEYIFEGSIGNDYPVALFAMLYQLQPDVDVALAFNGPGGRNWKKFERAFKKICKTLQPLEVARTEAAPASGLSLRDAKRATLAEEVARSPGWELYETPNYFVISSNDDRQFLQELMERLEAIRTVYEETYPAALAEELRVLAAQRRHEEGEGESDEDEDDAEGDAAEQEPAEDEGRTQAAPADPMELSRTSVVRVCKDRDEYHSYGGPGGSAGYWSSFHKELVIFDDKAGGGREDTWLVLNHEAFHQYIFYFFGNLAPHSWYNEGTGDFYSGYQYKNGRFELKPFDWRVQTIKDAVKKEKHVPLKDLVRFTQAEYYSASNNKYGAGPGQNYAQGWSLIWFLRTGKKNARCWNDRWDTILDVYLRVLVETDDLDEAVDKAFAGVDWEELEECWKSYTL